MCAIVVIMIYIAIFPKTSSKRFAIIILGAQSPQYWHRGSVSDREIVGNIYEANGRTNLSSGVGEKVQSMYTHPISKHVTENKATKYKVCRRERGNIFIFGIPGIDTILICFTFNDKTTTVISYFKTACIFFCVFCLGNLTTNNLHKKMLLFTWSQDTKAR